MSPRRVAGRGGGPVHFSAASPHARGGVSLNRILGGIPLVGNLFHSGEGFLAVRYSVRGDLDDPKISVHALDSLTPEFLKGLFSKEEQP